MERALSKYARTFDDSNPHWDRNRVNNLMFLKRYEAYANDLLKNRR